MATDQARLVSAIYDAAIEPDLWPTVLDSIAGAFGAAGAAYFGSDKRTGRVRFLKMVGPQAGQTDDYIDHFGPLDPYRKILEAASTPRWEWITGCLPAEKLRGDEWYNDFILRGGVSDALGARIYEDDSIAVLFGLHWARKQRSFDVPPPHLQPVLEALGKAARLHCTLDQVGWKSLLALQALDRITTGVIVTDESGRVIDCNAAAERILSLDNGLGIRGGLLAPRRAFEALKLARMIATATARTDQETGHMLIGRPGGHAAYVVTVAPLGAQFASGGRPLAMVMVADPDEHAPAHRDLAELFGFSPAESRLAAALMEGRKLDQITRELGVRITTLRTQLSSILKKVGVERQADLIRVLSAVRLVDTKPSRS